MSYTHPTVVAIAYVLLLAMLPLGVVTTLGYPRVPNDPLFRACAIGSLVGWFPAIIVLLRPGHHPWWALVLAVVVWGLAIVARVQARRTQTRDAQERQAAAEAAAQRRRRRRR